MPTSAQGSDDPDNRALSCRPCNQLKGKWDPSGEAGPGADRGALVAAARRYVQRRRAEAQRKLAGARALIGREIDL